MTLKQLSLLSLFFITISVSAQETEIKVPDNTLEGQFTEVVSESNNYQDYKVIKETKIDRLKKNVLDTVAALEKQINSTSKETGDRKNRIASLETELTTTKEELKFAKERENGIEVMGVVTEKNTYNIIMWSIIVILLAFLGFFVYRFSKSHTIIKTANLKLAETEMELEVVRQKHLEKEQKLRRKLQDEINKKR